MTQVMFSPIILMSPSVQALTTAECQIGIAPAKLWQLTIYCPPVQHQQHYYSGHHGYTVSYTLVLFSNVMLHGFISRSYSSKVNYCMFILAQK